MRPKIIAFVLGCAFFEDGGDAAAKAAFEEYGIELGGRLACVIEEDMNGDGREDLVISEVRGVGPAARRFVSVRLGVEGRGFPDSAASEAEAPGDAVAFDAVAASGGRPAEVLFAGSGGVEGVVFQNGRLSAAQRSEVGAKTWITGPEPDDLPCWDFAADFNGDGALEAMLPVGDGIAFFSAGEWGWRESEVVGIRTKSFYDAYSAFESLSHRGKKPFSFRMVSVVPRVQAGDYDGDGKPELFSIWEDGVEVFGQDGQGGFSEKPEAVFSAGLLSNAERAEGAANVHLLVSDVDGDGIADVVANKISGGLRSMRSLLLFFRGAKGGGFGSAPVSRIERDGFAGLPRIEDADADGRNELGLTEFGFTLVNLARALVSGGVQMSFNFYGVSGGGIDAKPEMKVPLNYPISYARGADLSGAAPVFGRDFNCDSVPDLAYVSGGELIVLKGEKGASFGQELFRGKAGGAVLHGFRFSRSSEALLTVDTKDTERHSIVVFIGPKCGGAK